MDRFVDPDWMTQTEVAESTGKGLETLGAPLCTGVIRAVIITTEGLIVEIPLHFWRGNCAQKAFDTGQATVGSGPPIYRPDLCERVLYKRVVTGRVAYSRKDVEAWLASLETPPEEANGRLPAGGDLETFEYVEEPAEEALAAIAEAAPRRPKVGQVYEYLLVLAENGPMPKLQYKEAAEAHFGMRLPEKNLWLPAWRKLSSDKKLGRGQKKKR
jgi:hypothetical protein